MTDQAEELKFAMSRLENSIGSDAAGTDWETLLNQVMEELVADEELEDAYAFLRDPDRVPGLIVITSQRLIAIGDRPLTTIRLEDVMKMREAWIETPTAPGAPLFDYVQRLRLTMVDGSVEIWDMRGNVTSLGLEIFNAISQACPDLSEERLAMLQHE